jgi:hypothetical protein
MIKPFFLPGSLLYVGGGGTAIMCLFHTPKSNQFSGTILYPQNQKMGWEAIRPEGLKANSNSPHQASWLPSIPAFKRRFRFGG